MNDDDFQRMTELATSDARSDLAVRLQSEKRRQERDRRLRSVCRVIGAGAALLCIVSALLAAPLKSTALIVAAGLAALTTLIAGGILFFKGGLAPLAVREYVLTDKERERLDN